MPYQESSRLPRERSGRLGHLEILKSELVNRLVETFEDPEIIKHSSTAGWELVQTNSTALPLVFGIDGSMQIVRSDMNPHKTIAYIKAALLQLDEYALSKVDTDAPHPFALKDILAESAMYHATALPMRNVSVQGLTTYDAVRQIIFESLKDASLEGSLLETLKWIAYEKWEKKRKPLPLFECPHCGKTVATLPYDEEDGKCQECRGEIFISDMLGFHLDMTEDSAADTVAMAYMNIVETLLLFCGIRFFWENNIPKLSDCLFIKDGPLSIRAQYSKLVNPIRRFLTFARDQQTPVHIFGQEKTGNFVDHLELIGGQAPEKSVFLLSGKYIKEQIYHRPDHSAPYGRDTNYGAKMFVKIDGYHRLVLSVPTGLYVEEPSLSDLIGIERILATLPRIVSHRHEGALLPIELAHGITSLSTYPSARILRVFTEAKNRKSPTGYFQQRLFGI